MTRAGGDVGECARDWRCAVRALLQAKSSRALTRCPASPPLPGHTLFSRLVFGYASAGAGAGAGTELTIDGMGAATRHATVCTVQLQCIIYFFPFCCAADIRCAMNRTTPNAARRGRWDPG
jgi:hypothetical protein